MKNKVVLWSYGCVYMGTYAAHSEQSGNIVLGKVELLQICYQRQFPSTALVRSTRITGMWLVMVELLWDLKSHHKICWMGASNSPTSPGGNKSWPCIISWTFIAHGSFMVKLGKNIEPATWVCLDGHVPYTWRAILYWAGLGRCIWQLHLRFPRMPINRPPCIRFLWLEYFESMLVGTMFPVSSSPLYFSSQFFSIIFCPQWYTINTHTKVVWGQNSI